MRQCAHRVNFTRTSRPVRAKSEVMRSILALEDGRSFVGESFGAEGTSVGEVCFNTSMSGSKRCSQTLLTVVKWSL
jgi:hypothetical protein